MSDTSESPADGGRGQNTQADDALTRSPLAERHATVGARLGAFAGWAMPIRFAGTLREHAAVRERVGLFDVSHLGTVFVEGPDALEVVAGSFTNDPARLDDGMSQYTLCCDERGGIVDDLIVYRRDPQRFLAIPNAANTAVVVEVLRERAAGRRAEVRDESAAWAVIAVQGPDALGLVDGVLAGSDTDPGTNPGTDPGTNPGTNPGTDPGTSPGTDPGTSPGDVASTTPYLGVVDIEVGGVAALLARTGYTGERGVELLVPAALAPDVWDRLTEAGAERCGLGARDTLRLEMGYPLHGNDLTADTTPFEARLGWAVKLDREPFRGSVALRAAKEAGPSRRLWGLQVEGRRPARAGMRVFVGAEAVGTLSSGTLSPTRGHPIALAYLSDPLGPGDEVVVDVRGSRTRASVVRPPFVDRDPRA